MHIIYLHAYMCTYARSKYATKHISNNSCAYFYLLGVLQVLVTLYLYVLSKVLLRF